MTRTTAAELEALLRGAFAPSAISVRDDSALHAGHAGAREGGHYAVALTSTRFSGLPRIGRHRLVYDFLGPLGARGIHALALQTRAPDDPPVDA